MKRSKFRDTPFNQDCVHRTHFVPGDRCPWCNEESYEAIGTRLRAQAKWTLILAFVAWVVWRLA